MLLAAAGRTAAAASIGVALRLLTGLHALNGIVATGLFPRLARRSGTWEPAEKRAAVDVLYAMLAVAALALACSIAAAPLLAEAFLPGSGYTEEVVLSIVLSGAGATALALQLGFVFLARRLERAMLVCSIAGAAVTTVGGVIATAGLGDNAALVMAGAFVAGQLTLGLALAFRAVSLSVLPRRPIIVASGVIVLLPALAAGATLGSVRLPIAAALVAGSVLSLIWLLESRLRPRSLA